MIKSAGCVCGISVIAGCSTGGGPDSGIEEEVQEQVGPDLTVTGDTAETTTFGNVEIATRVCNEGAERGSATLWAEVIIEGGETYQESRQVAMGVDECRDFEFGFDIPATTSLSGASYSYQTWVEQ
ncbi:hypothetical protein [Halonotius sp. GCM10025705]|uniref:hypothetical protein n=1 Tax=Halonotius sp. GCM10025705 TaxID=3252678 RepID=UPI003609FEC6